METERRRRASHASGDSSAWRISAPTHARGWGTPLPGGSRISCSRSQVEGARRRRWLAPRFTVHRRFEGISRAGNVVHERWASFRFGRQGLRMDGRMRRSPEDVASLGTPRRAKAILGNFCCRAGGDSARVERRERSDWEKGKPSCL